MNDDDETARARLSGELDAAWDDFNQELWQVTSRWVVLPPTPFGRGPHFTSHGILAVAMWLHSALFVAGVTLLLVSGANRDLGVALVVGSLFGIGAIAGQASYAAWTYEQALRDRALGEFEYEELMRLGAQVQEKRARLRDSEQD